MKIFLDPGHGMGNRKTGQYDPGACVQVGGKEITEADIALTWCNELRALLQGMGHTVVRSRKDARDPAPVIERAHTALTYGCEVFISLHCNAANGAANGTETYFRGAKNRSLAQACNAALVKTLGTKDRGIKTEQQSQHAKLAVLAFPRAVLIELGFIDHPGDRVLLLDPVKTLEACTALAEAITS